MTALATPRVLLIGGTSEIGLAIVRQIAARGSARPYLMGRDRARLTAALADLHRFGCEDGAVAEVDAVDVASHAAAMADAFALWDGFEIVILAVGRLGGQAGVDTPTAEALEVMQVNFLGSGSLAMEALRAMRERGHGTLVVLSSVAGERVRASNAIYGAAKAGLDGLAQGLADGLVGTGVRVLVVRPGFVTTRMTAGLPAAPLSVTADEVALATVAALDRRVSTIWVPRTLRYLFAILRHLPRWLFRRLPL
jgi:decaprenylphospho-beta-D-erythro-pentofuranosid-2-ulose 2-reductase